MVWRARSTGSGSLPGKSGQIEFPADLIHAFWILEGNLHPGLFFAAFSLADFLGFGLPPGAPSLGELVAQGKSNLQAPWLGISAFAVLAVMLSLLVFIGEAARDAFDPRK